MPQATFLVGTASDVPASYLDGALVVIKAWHSTFQARRTSSGPATLFQPRRGCHLRGRRPRLNFWRRSGLLRSTADEKELTPPPALFREVGFRSVRVLLHADGTRSHFERYRLDVYLGNEVSVQAPTERAWAAGESFETPGVVRCVPNAALQQDESATEGNGMWLHEIVTSAANLLIEARPSSSPGCMDVLLLARTSYQRMPYCEAFHMTNEQYCVRRHFRSPPRNVRVTFCDSGDMPRTERELAPRHCTQPERQQEQTEQTF